MSEQTTPRVIGADEVRVGQRVYAALDFQNVHYTVDERNFSTAQCDAQAGRLKLISDAPTEDHARLPYEAWLERELSAANVEHSREVGELLAKLAKVRELLDSYSTRDSLWHDINRVLLCSDPPDNGEDLVP